MTKKLATVFKNNNIYLVGSFTIFSLFGIILILLGGLEQNINWLWGGLGVSIIGITLGLTLILLSIFAIIDAVKKRKLKKANSK